MGSMAQTGLLLVPSDALGHTWALPGVLGGGLGLPPPNWPEAPLLIGRRRGAAAGGAERGGANICSDQVTRGRDCVARFDYSSWVTSSDMS